MPFRAFVLCIFLLNYHGAFAQHPVTKEPKYGEVTPADFKPGAYAIDSSAEAVVLYDGGSARYEGNGNSWFDIVYTYHRRIRLLNKNSFGEATVQIPLFNLDDKQDLLDKLDATTYTLENGEVVKTRIDKSSVFKDKATPAVTIKKFTFPNLKEGCIIEYTYSIISPRGFLRDWQFQDKYPVLLSEYQTAIPTLFNYVFLNTGYYDLVPAVTQTTENFRLFFKDNTGTGTSAVGNFNATVINSKWSLSDLPAMVKENYTSAVSNYISRIEFQLRSINMPNSEPRPIMQTWDQLISEMLKDDRFGAGLSEKNNWLDADLSPLIVKGDSLQTAGNIFAYVRDKFTCTDFDRFLLTGTLKEAFNSGRGSDADANLLLVAVLRKAGLAADPVLLSTRANGFAFEEYPLVDKFNYVIARTMIGGKEYLLDASHKKNGFNHLPEECYNGYARVINSQTRLIPLLADSLRENKTTTIYIYNSADGKRLEGNFNSNLGYRESYKIRGKDSTDYFKKIKSLYPFEIDLSNEGIDSLRQYDDIAAVHYDFSFSFDDDIVYYSPLLAEGYRKNPFEAAVRNYPVEMPSRSDELILVNMDIPKGYKVDETPKSVHLQLADNKGDFEYLVQVDPTLIQVRCRLKMNTATFAPEDYDVLREFFSKLVQKESEQIVFKKIK